MYRQWHILIFFSLSYLVSSSLLAAWSHIELGAANYGTNVHGDTYHKVKGNLSEHQHDLLFKTLDNLISRKGEVGVLYINDLQKVDVEFTIEKLNNYIKESYPNSQIELKELVGNFFKIDLPQVDSIHLKNPEYWFFLDANIYDNRYFMRSCANSAKEGLTLVTYYKKALLSRIKDYGVGYKILNESYDSYTHADGEKMDGFGNVVEFLIKSKKTIKAEIKTKKIAKKEFSTKSVKFKDSTDERTAMINHQYSAKK